MAISSSAAARFSEWWRPSLVARADVVATAGALRGRRLRPRTGGRRVWPHAAIAAQGALPPQTCSRGDRPWSPVCIEFGKAQVCLCVKTYGMGHGRPDFAGHVCVQALAIAHTGNTRRGRGYLRCRYASPFMGCEDEILAVWEVPFSVKNGVRSGKFCEQGVFACQRWLELCKLFVWSLF